MCMNFHEIVEGQTLYSDYIGFWVVESQIQEFFHYALNIATG